MVPSNEFQSLVSTEQYMIARQRESWLAHCRSKLGMGMGIVIMKFFNSFVDDFLLY